MSRESAIVAAIRLAFGADPRVVLWRNQIGNATYPAAGGRARHVPYGVGGRGGADLVGILCSGPRAGAFVAIEVKSDGGVVSDEQSMFLALVHRAGGVAIVARSVADVATAISDATRAGADATRRQSVDGHRSRGHRCPAGSARW